MSQAMTNKFKSKKKKKKTIAEDEHEDEGEGEEDREDGAEEDDEGDDIEEDQEDEEESDEESLVDDEVEQDAAVDDESDDDEVDEDREECAAEELEQMREQVEEELTIDRSLLKGPRLAIQRVMLIARRTHYSSARQCALKQYCVRKEVPPKILPRAVVTRWTLLTNTIGVALQIRPAVDLLTKNPEHKITHLALNEEQWEFLSLFHPILDVSTFLYPVHFH